MVSSGGLPDCSESGIGSCLERLGASITLREYINERTFAGVSSPDWGRPRAKMAAGVAPYRAASWPRDRAPPGRKPRVSAHSGYGRSAGAVDLSAPHSPR